LTFKSLFSIPKDTIIISKPSKSLDILKVSKLKASKLLTARNPPVSIPVSIIVILKYNKEGDIASKIRDIGRIRSSQGRTIRPTDKGLAIRRKIK
jgi:hypothetical protein